MLIEGASAGAEPVLGDMRDAGGDRLARIAASQLSPADVDRPG